MRKKQKISDLTCIQCLSARPMRMKLGDLTFIQCLKSGRYRRIDLESFEIWRASLGLVQEVWVFDYGSSEPSTSLSFQISGTAGAHRSAHLLLAGRGASDVVGFHSGLGDLERLTGKNDRGFIIVVLSVQMVGAQAYSIGPREVPGQRHVQMVWLSCTAGGLAFVACERMRYGDITSEQRLVFGGREFESQGVH